VQQRRLAPETCARACADTNAVADTVTLTDRLPDARSVCCDGRRNMRERRLAAAWDRAATSSDTHPNTVAHADSNNADAWLVLDSGSVRRNGRRNLRQRWLAAAWNRAAAEPGANTDADSHPFALTVTKLCDPRSVHHDSGAGRDLRERRLDSNKNRDASGHDAI